MSHMYQVGSRTAYLTYTEGTIVLIQMLKAGILAKKYVDICTRELLTTQTCDHHDSFGDEMIPR